MEKVSFLHVLFYSDGGFQISIVGMEPFAAYNIRGSNFRMGINYYIVQAIVF